jgi:hypothetical protein
LEPSPGGCGVGLPRLLEAEIMRYSNDWNKTTGKPQLIFLIVVTTAFGCYRSDSNRTEPPIKEEQALLIQPSDDGKTIVTRFMRTLSGGDKPLLWDKGFVKYKARVGISGIEDGESLVEDTFDLPRHWKRRVWVKTPRQQFQMIFVTNDGKGWKKIGEDEARPAEMKYEMKEHDFAMYWNFAPLLEEKAEFKRIAEEKVDGHSTVVVRLKADQRPDVELYFDKHNNLLIKSKKSLPGKTPESSMVMESLLDDYQVVHGKTIPMRIRSYQNGEAMLDVTLIEVKFLEKVDPSEFQKP